MIIVGEYLDVDVPSDVKLGEAVAVLRNQAREYESKGATESASYQREVADFLSSLQEMEA